MVLAPVHIDQTTDWRLQEPELGPSAGFAVQLQRSAKKSEMPAAHIWSLLDPKTKQRIEEYDEEKTEHWKRPRIHDELNELLESESFYDKAAWADVRLNREARQLLKDREAGASVETLQLNRRLFESAFRDIPKCEGAAYRFGYLSWTSDYAGHESSAAQDGCQFHH